MNKIKNSKQNLLNFKMKNKINNLKNKLFHLINQIENFVVKFYTTILIFKLKKKNKKILMN